MTYALKDCIPEYHVSCHLISKQGFLPSDVYIYGFMDVDNIRKVVLITPHENILDELSLEKFSCDFSIENIVKLSVCINSSDLFDKNGSTREIEDFMEEWKDEFIVKFKRRDHKLRMLLPHVEIIKETPTFQTVAFGLMLSSSLLQIFYEYVKSDPKFYKHQKHSKGPFCINDLDMTLDDETDLMDFHMFNEIAHVLPIRCYSHRIKKIFTTAKDGYCLRTMFDKSHHWLSSCRNHFLPWILIVRDTKGCIFGAVLSNHPHRSSSFFGSGETFLYTFKENEFKIYTWTEKNSFFILGQHDSLSVGSGDGKYGLFIDSSLHHGYSQPCETFNNQILASSEYFTISVVELWAVC